MREAFIKWRPSKKHGTMAWVDNANAILEEYHGLGITMTVRGLHYQFVARGLYDNTKKNYDKLVNTLSKARLGGYVDWDYMEDNVRMLARIPSYISKQDMMSNSPFWYHEDPWELQEVYPEVHVEKDALIGTIESICNELRVPHFACRGYVSASAQYHASKRFLEAIRKGKRPIIFHLGDHDPSGIDMTRENEAKFELLTGETVEVRRLALNIDQVRRYNPPPNFAKLKDPRAGAYVRKFGKKSWELDALEPRVVQGLIRKAIEPLIDKKQWGLAMRSEAERKKEFKEIHGRWQDVENLMRGESSIPYPNAS
jgi:hypothetical protein